MNIYDLHIFEILIHFYPNLVFSSKTGKKFSRKWL